MRPNLSFIDVQYRHHMKERFSMMKNNMTELVFILDRSGSMSGLESDTVGGFNSMIEKQKKHDGECYVSTVLFDNESEVLHDRVKLSDIPKMTDKDYTVRGCTALIDAIGGAIHHIGNIHKYARPEDVPEHTMFVITTDGQENASHRYTSEHILYESVAKAVCNVRANAPLSENWSAEINADYQRRGSKNNKK